MSKQRSGLRDAAALLELVPAIPIVLIGLALPRHVFWAPASVSSDSLDFSVGLTAFGVVLAVLPLIAWPRIEIRLVALVVLILAIWGLGDCLSYYWWRSDLIDCSGGGCGA